MIKCILLLCIACSLITGCATSSMYEWGDYEKDLYLYYKDPENLDEYMDALQEIVSDSEKADKVPPGMYAEFGYILYEQGRIADAKGYFQKEKDRWPESALFMDMAIGNLTESAPQQQPDSKSVTQQE